MEHKVNLGASAMEPQMTNIVDETSMSPPPPMSASDIASRILRQMEKYLSDENLLRDRLLQKHLLMDETQEGYIPLDLFSSFAKIKKITIDQDVLRDSLKQSELLVLNPAGTHVKRRVPLALPAKATKAASTAILKTGKTPSIPKQTIIIPSTTTNTLYSNNNMRPDFSSPIKDNDNNGTSSPNGFAFSSLSVSTPLSPNMDRHSQLNTSSSSLSSSMPLDSGTSTPTKLGLTNTSHIIESNTIYASHIPKNSDKQSLHNIFAICGPITRIDIPVDKKSGTSKGIAFIEFETEDQAKEAVNQFNMDDNLFFQIGVRVKPYKMGLKTSQLQSNPTTPSSSSTPQNPFGLSSSQGDLTGSHSAPPSPYSSSSHQPQDFRLMSPPLTRDQSRGKINTSTSTSTNTNTNTPAAAAANLIPGSISITIDEDDDDDILTSPGEKKKRKRSKKKKVATSFTTSDIPDNNTSSSLGIPRSHSNLELSSSLKKLGLGVPAQQQRPTSSSSSSLNNNKYGTADSLRRGGLSQSSPLSPPSPSSRERERDMNRDWRSTSANSAADAIAASSSNSQFLHFGRRKSLDFLGLANQQDGQLNPNQLLVNNSSASAPSLQPGIVSQGSRRKFPRDFQMERDDNQLAEPSGFRNENQVNYASGRRRSRDLLAEREEASHSNVRPIFVKREELTVLPMRQPKGPDGSKGFASRARLVKL